MKKMIFKKFRWLNIIMLAQAAVCLSSCNENLDPWEILAFETSNTLTESNEVDCNGSSFTVSIKSNSDWTIKAPDWITADKMEGNGDAVVNFVVAKNETLRYREGEVEITAGSIGESNVVGHGTDVIDVKQKSKSQDTDIQVTSAEFTYNVLSRFTYRSNYYYKYSRSINVSFTINSELADDELANYADSAYLVVVSRGYSYKYNSYEDTYSYSLNGPENLEFQLGEIKNGENNVYIEDVDNGETYIDVFNPWDPYCYVKIDIENVQIVSSNFTSTITKK